MAAVAPWSSGGEDPAVPEGRAWGQTPTLVPVTLREPQKDLTQSHHSRLKFTRGGPALAKQVFQRFNKRQIPEIYMNPCRSGDYRQRPTLRVRQADLISH